MMQNLRYFTSSIWVTLAGLGGAWAIAGLEGLWIATVLAVLEVSLSFDNAVVNAKILKDMDALWRHRFITWGMFFAVFAVRFFLPLLIVSVTAGITPWGALDLAMYSPEHYKEALESAHPSIMAFGGSFLGMVGLKFFIDNEKDFHWLEKIESKLTKLGKIEAIQSAIVMMVLYIFYKLIGSHSQEEATSFLVSGIFGLIIYIVMDGIGAVTVAEEGELTSAAVKSGLASFLYLEILDLSFSLDGVVSAMALTMQLSTIVIGLTIGSLFVRSLTLLMVDKGTSDEYKFLEHGAHWAILSLSGIMFLNTIIEIPEAITGLIGAGLIGISFWSSVQFNKRELQHG